MKAVVVARALWSVTTQTRADFPSATAFFARSSADEALIDVIDSGPGVPAEERDSIFDSFFRGRAKASARVEGTGLGLAIAREFVEAHGGRISVLAEERGAHFRVALPRRRAA